MDFFDIKVIKRSKDIIICPEFKVKRSKDLMVRGKSFYGIWDEQKNLWSTDEYDVQRLIDKELSEYYEQNKNLFDEHPKIKFLEDFSNNAWTEFKNFLSKMSDNYKQLDNKIVFSNDNVNKNDYISKKLSYPLEKGPHKAYDELFNTLYSKEELKKVEWAIGSIICGDSKTIQKFIVLYGEPGSGKGTLLNLIQKLFEGYYITFEAEDIVTKHNNFSVESFRSNPLVGIQMDGDLSHIENNTKLNTIVSHEEMQINEKFKSVYSMKINCFLFLASNKPVKITDGKSGIIRRLIDVQPSNKKININKYNTLVSQLNFELGAIAEHCLSVYRKLGKNYYNDYKPIDMIYKTDLFYNFVDDNYMHFKNNDGCTLKEAYNLYKEYCDTSGAEYKLPLYKFREELKNYFNEFMPIARVDGVQVRSYFSGFIKEKFSNNYEEQKEEPYSLILDKKESILDTELKDMPAQYATKNGVPYNEWKKVKTTLKDIDTKKLHYTKCPINMIVIDFDIKDDEGNKSLQKNIEAANKWPQTYAELSKSGFGIHLHYYYDGDVNELSSLYDENIEIKKFVGDSALRRKLSYCNNIPFAHINTGLPLKEKKNKMLNVDSIKSEKSLRLQIKRNLLKEIHPYTAPSVSFIKEILDGAYESGLKYDVSDLRSYVLTFAMGSTHQRDKCVKMVSEMKFKSEEPPDNEGKYEKDDPITFFDVEVFPNLFLVGYKEIGKNKPKQFLINPTAPQIENFILHKKLIGFNVRRYDNHMCYACMMGRTPKDIFELSKKIIGQTEFDAGFIDAYKLSYTDIYDYSSVKQSLKKWEIDLGLYHKELDLPWDQDVKKEDINKVIEYNGYDLDATEAVWNETQEDFKAREILAKLSGLTVNDSTRAHATKIIFGNDKHPQDKFNYINLSEMFPGYKYENGKSSYRGEDPGEGGYVYAEPGIYKNVALIDVASMHPSSLINMNMFGPYTKNFEQIKQMRVAIKHKDYETAKKMFDGKCSEFLNDPDEADNLSYALKIVINSVYGYTKASFDCPFKDPRNVDNIVAKRGALFMIDLKHAVQEQGYKVIHIKTDSIKIPDADNNIINFVINFGKKYGYDFEYNPKTDFYQKICLVNDAVYIAKYNEPQIDKEGKKKWWTATGTQFQVPFVFKTLFSHEKLELNDYSVINQVKDTIYMDFNEKLNENEHNYMFIGKIGKFVPVIENTNGAELMVLRKDKYSYVTGSKGWRWKEFDIIKINKLEKQINLNYFRKFVDEAKETISQYGNFDLFIE